MSTKSLVLVIIQFSSFLYFGVDGSVFAFNYLFIIQILALGLGFWGINTMKYGNFNVQPEVKEHAQFISKGPYKIIRNPMYAGLIIFFGISVINKFNLIRLFVWLLLDTSLILKIYAEEIFLTERFGNIYLDYKKNTSRLIPFIF
jgi:protein-S-isoprenylcysteine O-methyltransferase Ste14